jgi:uncharacterized protein
MEIKELLQEKRAEILKIAAQYGASNVRIFGSVARGEATVDVTRSLPLKKVRAKWV